MYKASGFVNNDAGKIRMIFNICSRLVIVSLLIPPAKLQFAYPMPVLPLLPMAVPVPPPRPPPISPMLQVSYIQPRPAPFIVAGLKFKKINIDMSSEKKEMEEKERKEKEERQKREREEKEKREREERKREERKRKEREERKKEEDDRKIEFEMSPVMMLMQPPVPGYPMMPPMPAFPMPVFIRRAKKNNKTYKKNSQSSNEGSCECSRHCRRRHNLNYRKQHTGPTKQKIYVDL